MRTRMRSMVVAACLSWVLVGAAWADTAAGPKDQFQSVVYVRKGGAPVAMYEKLRPDTLAMLSLPDFYKWGGKYVYSWFNPVMISFEEETALPDPKSPDAYVNAFTKGMWKDWDKFRAAGVVTGERPARFEDLCFVAEDYARALRDGAARREGALPGPPLPERLVPTNGKFGTLCIANPDVVRIMADIAKFNAAHVYKKGLGSAGAPLSLNGGFIDLAGIPQMDFSEYARKQFDAWLRANYTPEQIRTILQTDPAQPIPLLTPKGASAQLAQIYERMRREFFWNNLLPQHCRGLKEAIDSVLGPGKFHFIYHGDGYEWRVIGAYGTNMVVWGDWMDSYCTECARTPGVQTAHFYAFPSLVPRQVSDFYRNRNNSNNVYDYQYGAGRLWGEPVVVKTGFRGPGPFSSAATIDLGLAEGLALLGNMRIDAGNDTSMGKEVPASLALPMVDFMHRLAPQERQMIPAATVGALFSPADSYLFRGFDSPSNDTQAYQLSNILHAEHVPLQVVPIQLLERSLAQRPLEVLVLPWLKCVKDDQAATVVKFVQDGGKALFIGADCGTLTWEGLKREKNAFAELLPAADGSKVSFKQVGKGRTALIPGALDDSLASAQNLQRALFELLGHPPSCIAPDRYPLLLTNLTRNSDNSRFWMHLVNFNVELGQRDAEKPTRPAENVRVVAPLPAGLRAKAATLYRPRMEDLKLTVEEGREGCAVTVPHVEVYALVAVETEPGARSDKPLGQPGGDGSGVPPLWEDAVNSVARSFDAQPARRSLVAPSGLPAADGKNSPRNLQRDVIAYATSTEGQAVNLVVEGKPDCAVYASDGSRLSPDATTQGTNTTFSVKAPPPGAHLCFMLHLQGNSRVAFTHPGGAVFEASAASPLTLSEEGDSAPLYFHVPANCKAFKLYPNTTIGNHLWALHLVVKDGAGQACFDSSAVFDGDGKKAIDIPVPAGQGGKVWSLWFLDAKGDAAKKSMDKSYVQFYLDGVPPVVANSPAQLLIAKGDG